MEKANISIEDIRRQCFQIKSQLGGLDAIFIDHVHIIGDGDKKFNSIREKIIHISGAMKVLAKEIEVPIFALAQNNRNQDSRQDKVPYVSDLKESGSLEQDADAIVFTYRGTDPDKHEDSYVICRKNRHGSKSDFKIFVGVDPVTKLLEEVSPRN